MNLLALDTSSNACSVALQTGDKVDVSHVVKPREHTVILIPMIEAVLRAAKISTDDLDGIVLGNGPGSFIGMRIAASVAQGIAFGAGLKIVPVSSLATIAAETFSVHDATRVLVAQDAHMNEVYLAAFTRGEDGMPVAEGAVSLHKVTDSLGEVAGGNVVAAGAGWQRYPELFQANEGIRNGQVDIHHPNARYLLGQGMRDWIDGRAISADEIVPEYVRMKVASVPAARSK